MAKPRKTRTTKSRKGSQGPSDEKLRTLCTRLEVVFAGLDAIYATVSVCQRLCAKQDGEDERAIATVLGRSALDPLFRRLKELTRVVEALGGQTAYSEDMENDDEEDEEDEEDEKD